MVKVHELPNGEPFAVVIEDDTQARTSVAADGSSVTVILRRPGMMPCSLIFPELVAAQVFGPNFAATAPEEVTESDSGHCAGGGV